MRRFLALLLLAILPLQLSWAGVAVYCQHEPAQSAQHFGHHAHEVQAQADDSGDSSAQGAGGVDCSYHLPAAKCYFEVLSLVDPALTDVLNASPPVAFSSFIPSGLDRPDRRSAVLSASGGVLPARS